MWGFVLAMCQLSAVLLVSLLSRWCGLWMLSLGQYEDSMKDHKGQPTSFQCYAHMSKEPEGRQNSEVVVARESIEKSQGNEIKDLCKNFHCSV